MIIGLPPSIERRNARERNRVKQVNNGFDRLRQYIPRAIIEPENGGRGPSKKLSKVDTLKYVVKYIQGLKHLLDEYDDKLNQNEETMSTISSASSHKSSGIHSASDSFSLNSSQSFSGGYSVPCYDYQNHQQENHQQHREISYSEPSSSPTPSEMTAASSQQGHGFYSETAQNEYQFHYQQAVNKGYTKVEVRDDSGFIEEDAILDDILYWQMQNSWKAEFSCFVLKITQKHRHSREDCLVITCC